MNNTIALTREQELEILFLDFIKEVVQMRRYQIKFDTEFGSANKVNKHRQQDKLDGILATMGITPETDLKEIKKISLVKEKLG